MSHHQYWYPTPQHQQPPPPPPPSQQHQSSHYHYIVPPAPPPPIPQGYVPTSDPVYDAYASSNPPRRPPSVFDRIQQRRPPPPPLVSKPLTQVHTRLPGLTSPGYIPPGYPDLSQLNINSQQHRFYPDPRQVSRYPPSPSIRSMRKPLPPGYKSPSVEDVPSPPSSLASLPVDSPHVLEDDEDYFSSLSFEEKAKVRAPKEPEGPKLVSTGKAEKYRTAKRGGGGVVPGLARSESWKRYPVPLYGNASSPDGDEDTPPPRSKREDVSFTRTETPENDMPPQLGRERRPYQSHHPQQQKQQQQEKERQQQQQQQQQQERERQQQQQQQQQERERQQQQQQQERERERERQQQQEKERQQQQLERERQQQLERERQLENEREKEKEQQIPQEQLPRKSRPYFMKAPASPPPAAERESRPYSMKPETPPAQASPTSREAKRYSHKPETPPPHPPARPPYSNSPITQTKYPPPSQPSPQQKYHQPPQNSQSKYQATPPKSTAELVMPLQSPQPPTSQPPRPSRTPQQQSQYRPPPNAPLQHHSAPPRHASPPKREPAPSLDLLPACPKNLVAWGKWYQLPAAPGFNVCIRCYYAHIYSTQFFNYFAHAPMLEGVETKCDFGTPHVLQRVWPQTLSSSSIDVLAVYARFRASIPACKGSAGTKGAPGLKWYTTYDGSIPGFLACAACYHDIILATAFGGHFIEAQPQPESQTWACHLSIPFIAGGIQELSKYQEDRRVDQWPDFANITGYRMKEVQPCPGTTPISVPGRKWWTPKQQILGLTICDACYCDEIVPSSFRAEFGSVLATSVPLSCYLAKFNLKCAFLAAVEKNSFKLFWDAARVTFSLPACTPKGLTGSEHEWYTLHSPELLKNFEFCKSCYYTLIVPLGFSQHFTPIHYPPGETRWCDLTPGSQRYKPTLKKLGEAADWNNFEIFRDYITPRSKFPPCAPGKFVEGAKWFGPIDRSWEVCEECWYEYIRSSVLASQVTSRGRHERGGQACDMYSPRMKKTWLAACNARDIKIFENAARERTRVYHQVVPRIAELEKEIALRSEAAVTMLQNTPLASPTTRGGDRGRWATAEQERYGYAAQAVVRSAEAVEAANAKMRDEILELEERWRRVE